MKYFLLLLIVLQPKTINVQLANQIEAMFKEDQRWRLEFIKLNKKEKSAYDEDTINEKWQEADSINELKAKAIVKKYGYPGYRLVGEAASDNFWAIIQHCDDDPAFQAVVWRLMGNELKNNNVSRRNYAYLTDRLLTNQHKKQWYGTQCTLNPKTHKLEAMHLQNPAKVDALRKSMGLEPMKVYLAELNQTYGY
jgi:hypothetical protein